MLFSQAPFCQPPGSKHLTTWKWRNSANIILVLKYPSMLWKWEYPENSIYNYIICLFVILFENIKNLSDSFIRLAIMKMIQCIWISKNFPFCPLLNAAMFVQIAQIFAKKDTFLNLVVLSCLVFFPFIQTKKEALSAVNSGCLIDKL